MDDVSPALSPAYPFPGPGAPIPLHHGALVVGGRSLPGRIDFRLHPRLDAVWTVEPNRHRLRGGDAHITIEHPLGTITTTSQRRSSTDGSLGPVEIGPADAPLQRVVTHWVNLHALPGTDDINDGSSTFTGRWSADLDGWAVVLDRRSDHKDVWSRIKTGGTTEVTHVMEIRRSDGSLFTAEEAGPLLDALHLGLSFAVGRWVAPILPVGFDVHGKRVWEQWATPHCTPGAPGALTWWFDQRGWELEELLRLLVARFADPSRRFSTRFLLASAILSAAGGFVEQRIMTAAAALEHLTWTALVVDGSTSKTAYEKIEPTFERLAKVGAEASIVGKLEETVTPALYGFAQSREPDRRTAPAVLHAVRNMIVHPTGHEEKLYRKYPGLVTETWLLAQHYLVLLILHHLGYCGAYQSQLKPAGWAGDVELVPWAEAPADS
ncbi:hypothetical protein [Pseudonocardia nigra]|uniref:hypothetical protein n=1 Tax=Pseudonocardia nigra TaxID=1921578 RepID=UPI001C5D0991|nr:hypothetical protein [Pseudonocardia nigra]